MARLDKTLGMQDIEIGVPEFDREFVLQGNDERKVRSLFANAELRQLVHDQKSAQVTLRGDELRLEVKGAVSDVPRLKALFKLFELTLDQLAA